MNRLFFAYRTAIGSFLILACTFALADGEDLLGDPESQIAEYSLGEVDRSRNIEFYASDKAAQINYRRDASAVSIDNGSISVGFLFNEKRDNVFMGGLTLDAAPEFLSNLTLSFGGKLYAGLLSVENSDVFGISMGIEGEYALQLDAFPLTVQAAVYYAPDILSFGQSDRIFDWNIKAGLRLRRTVFAFAGFRFLQFDTRPGNRKLDNSAHVGIRWYLN